MREQAKLATWLNGKRGLGVVTEALAKLAVDELPLAGGSRSKSFEEDVAGLDVVWQSDVGYWADPEDWSKAYEEDVEIENCFATWPGTGERELQRPCKVSSTSRGSNRTSRTSPRSGTPRKKMARGSYSTTATMAIKGARTTYPKESQHFFNGFQHHTRGGKDGKRKGLTPGKGKTKAKGADNGRYHHDTRRASATT